MVEIKTASEVEAMQAAGSVVARALQAVTEHAAVGVRLSELDAVAAEVIAAAGATSAFLHYRPHFAPTPFPAVICASLNDVIVHGIPDGYRLKDGDVLGVDCGAYLDGWAGDAAVTVTVGDAHPQDLELIETAERALAAGIAAAVPGNRLGDIGHAIAEACAGYGIPPDFGGHGIGRRMHEDPGVPNTGREGRGLRLRPGMTLAIEPMLVIGGDGRYRTDADGWALRSVSGMRAAHVEHTIAVTDAGPRILTACNSPE